METFEKQNLNQDKNTENKKPVNRVLQTAAKGTINWLKRNWKNSALLVAGGALSTGAFAQDPNNNERDVVKNKGVELIDYNKPKQINKNTKVLSIKDIKVELSKNGDHGDLNSVFSNKKANKQHLENIKEQNVFNSFEEIMNAIKNGKENHYYYPHAIGKQSPYWDKKPGNVEINSIEDYKKHVEENLRPNGFKGQIVENIREFGFRLEKNEFITTLKQDVVVDAKVIGGSGYVLLKAGTLVVMEITKINGRDCNKIVYIQPCMNKANGDNPYTNTDGSGGFRV